MFYDLGVCSLGFYYTSTMIAGIILYDLCTEVSVFCLFVCLFVCLFFCLFGWLVVCLFGYSYDEHHGLSLLVFEQMICVSLCLCL